MADSILLLGQVHALTYSAGQSQYLLTGSTDRTIRLFNPTTGRLIQKYEAHGYEVLDIAVSPDNARLVSGGGDKTVFLWDVASATTVRRFMGHVGRIEGVTFGGEDASIVVSGSYDGTVKLWDTKSQNTKPIMTLDEAKDSVSMVCVQDKSIGAGSVDGHVRWYDVRNGGMHQDTMGASVTSVTPAKDGASMLVSTLDSTIRLMDRTDGRCLQTLQAPEYVNTSYRLRSTLGLNDSIAISGSEDGWIVVWDLLYGNLVQKFRHSADSSEDRVHSFVSSEKLKKKNVVSTITICPTRREWASAGGDGAVVVWGELS